MAFIPTPATAKAALEFTFAGAPIVNTLWFTKSIDFDITDLGVLNQVLEQWWLAELRSLVSERSILDSISSYDMSSEFGPVSNYAVGSAGTAIGTVSSAQIVLTVSFKTNNRGRSGRGYNAWSPLLESQVEDNIIFPSVRNSVVAAYALLNSYVDAAFPGAAHVVCSFWQNSVARSEGFPQDVLNYSSITGYTRTQKRRRE